MLGDGDQNLEIGSLSERLACVAKADLDPHPSNFQARRLKSDSIRTVAQRLESVPRRIFEARGKFEQL